MTKFRVWQILEYDQFQSVTKLRESQNAKSYQNQSVTKCKVSPISEYDQLDQRDIIHCVILSILVHFGECDNNIMQTCMHCKMWISEYLLFVLSPIQHYSWQLQSSLKLVESIYLKLQESHVFVRLKQVDVRLHTQLSVCLHTQVVVRLQQLYVQLQQKDVCLHTQVFVHLQQVEISRRMRRRRRRKKKCII